MSPYDTPFALVLIYGGAGSMVGFAVFVGVCLVIERIRRGK